jgi:hypothetical protein
VFSNDEYRYGDQHSIYKTIRNERIEERIVRSGFLMIFTLSLMYYTGEFVSRGTGNV